MNNLPPLNQIAQGYTLPPVNQIPGYSVPGQPPANPGQQMHGFWADPTTGQGISVKNAGDAIYRAPQGNPLYYGQSAAYTGPSGPTDGAPTTDLPPVTDVAAGPGLTNRDYLMALYGPDISGYGGDRDVFLDNLLNNDEFRQAIEGGWGGSLDDQYDPASAFWKTLQKHIGKIGGNVWQGRGEGGNAGSPGPDAGQGGSDV